MRRVLRRIGWTSFECLFRLLHSIENVLKILRALAYSRRPQTYDDLEKKTGLSRSTIIRVLKKFDEELLTTSNYDIPYDEHPWLHEQLFGEPRPKGRGRPKKKIIFIPSLEERLREITLVTLIKKRRRGDISFEEFSFTGASDYF